jgi:hypothetical protein
MIYNITPHTDEERMNFLIENDVEVDNSTYFTCLTQHVNRRVKDTDGAVKDLREFCDYGIEFSLMLKANNIDRFGWDWMFLKHKQLYLDSWFNEHRPLNEKELKKIKDENDEYKELLKKVAIERGLIK